MPSVECALGHTWESLYGELLPVTELISIIESTNPSQLLKAFAIIGMKLAASSGSDIKEQWKLATELFPAEIIADMKARSDEGAGIFDNYGLNVLSQMTLRYGRFEENAGKNIRAVEIAVLILSINDVMRPAALKYETLYKCVALPKWEQEMLRYSIKRMVHATHENLFLEIARYHRLLNDIPNRQPFPVALGTSVDSFCRQHAGATVTENFFGGMAVQTYFLHYLSKPDSNELRDPEVDMDKWLQNLKDRTIIYAFLDRASKDRVSFTQLAIQSDPTENPYLWSHRCLREYPFIHNGERKYMMLSRPCLLNKSMDGFYYDIANKLSGGQRNKFTAWLGDCFEVYVGELCESVYVKACVRNPRHPADDSNQLADVVIVQGDTWIVIECKWHFWSLPVWQCGALQKSDWEQLVEKPFSQFATHIEDLLKDKKLLAINGVPKRIIPLVVGIVALTEMAPTHLLLKGEWEKVRAEWPVPVERPRQLQIQDLETVCEKPSLILPTLDLWREDALKAVDQASFGSAYNKLRTGDTPATSYLEKAYFEAMGKVKEMLKASINQ